MVTGIGRVFPGLVDTRDRWRLAGEVGLVPESGAVSWVGAMADGRGSEARLPSKVCRRPSRSPDWDLGH